MSKLVSNLADGGLLLTVDGPSGTGKSTTCRRLAKELNAAYVDTGAMYRVATLAVLHAGVDPADTAAVIEVTRALPMEVSENPESTEVLLAGRDVSEDIRSAEVTGSVSAVSAIPEVRHNLVELQRSLARGARRAIVEGRDIGTVVLPDAPCKVFLTASAQVRAQRRHEQNLAAGRDSDFEQVLADVQRRDELDSSRATSPLKPAEDAHIIDTSNMSMDEVIATLTQLLREGGQC